MNTKANTLPAVALLLDSCRGIYIPQHFVEEFDLTKWEGISEENKDILTSGPDHELYWEVWDEVTSRATFSENGYTWRLSQDGDLWALCIELMSDEEKRNFGFDD